VTRPPRHQAIIHLERTIYDLDYQPKTSTGSAIARNTKAESHEGNPETVLCPDCGGEGERRVRTVMQRCSLCKGRGVVVRDQYTKRLLKTEVQEGERPPKMVRCDECGGIGENGWWRNGDEWTRTCRRCWGAKVVPGPNWPIRPFRAPKPQPQNGERSSYGDPILACMERRQSEGSYDELWLALSALRLEHRPLYRINVAVYVQAEREEDELDRYQGVLLDESLAYLDSLMPVEIRVPAWAAQAEKVRRAKVESEREVAA
jgi:DnaJ-class molecular chaperone